MSDATETRTPADLAADVARLGAKDRQSLYALIEVMPAVSQATETPARKEQRRKGEVLEILTRVAERAKLAPGTAPTIAQYENAAAEIDAGCSSQQIIRLFGSWGAAQRALLEQDRSMSRANRKLRSRAVIGQTRTPAHYVAGVGLWLDTNPNDLRQDSYDAFVADYVPSKAVEDGLMPGIARTVLANLSISWNLIIRVAGGDLTLENAAEEQLAEMVPRGSPFALIGTAAIARLLGCPQSSAQALTDKQAFPGPVARICGERAWLVSEVRRFKRGLRCPARGVEELQLSYIDRDELEARLGLPRKSVEARIRQKRWDKLPEPEGAIARGRFYWIRDKVESWERIHAAASSGA